MTNELINYLAVYSDQYGKLLNLKFRQMSKKINKLNITSVYSIRLFQWEKSNLSH